jgi:hypothetical protein
LSKLETGKLGEAIVIGHLQHIEGKSDAKPAATNRNNYAVDVEQDHTGIEVKTGLVSNGKSAQHWRATIGQPGEKERAMLEKMSPAKKAAWNQRKAAAILDRKNMALKDLSKKLGSAVKGATMMSIINPDTRTADVYRAPNFHLRISWSNADKYYLGSYRF